MKFGKQLASQLLVCWIQFVRLWHCIIPTVNVKHSEDFKTCFCAKDIRIQQISSWNGELLSRLHAFIIFSWWCTGSYTAQYPERAAFQTPYFITFSWRHIGSCTVRYPVHTIQAGSAILLPWSFAQNINTISNNRRCFLLEIVTKYTILKVKTCSAFNLGSLPTYAMLIHLSCSSIMNFSSCIC